MAKALTLVEHPVIHCCTIPGNTQPTPGNCNIEDKEIARWCSEEERVLVTLDSDFRTRWVRSGLLAQHGVEVIVFNRDLKGLYEQHGRITRHLPYWQETLGVGGYEHRVWLQADRNAPTLQLGPKPRKKR